MKLQQIEHDNTTEVAALFNKSPCKPIQLRIKDSATKSGITCNTITSKWEKMVLIASRSLEF